jgi:glycine hydroxymethyltransferase
MEFQDFHTQLHLEIMNNSPLKEIDPVLDNLINCEHQRQNTHLELIASENITLPSIIEATGSILTNKYAEGYPQKRYYGGCRYVDDIEQLAINRVCELFGAEHANVQPHSGSQANIAVYMSVLKPGDKILTMSLEDGGHLTHGHPMNCSGQLYDVVNYGVNSETGLIDYDEIEQLAKTEKPRLITVGASAYSRTIDFERMGSIAKANDALLLADIAHIAGLVAAKVHPSPVPFADFVTTTTHKTLRGPRGGLIMCKEQYAKKIDSAIFPGTQGGPLMHVIAGKALCFKEANTSEFVDYQNQVVENSRTLANRMIQNQFKVVSGGTDNHLFMIDLRENFNDMNGKQAQNLLDSVNVTLNKNTVPNETRNPFQTSGIRIGTPAVTSRGMKQKEMEQIGDIITYALNNSKDTDLLETIRKSVMTLCEQFPLPY